MTRVDTTVQPDNPIFRADDQPWPEWVASFRQTQIDAMAEVLDHYARGADVVMLDAPTGTGKTLLAEMIRRAGNFDRALYVCNTIGLQEQMCRDFPYARLIKGRSNYLPLDGPAGATCGDCEGKECNWCIVDEMGGETRRCPYEIARGRALGSRLAVSNTAYFLAEANNVGKLGGRDLVIADESDTLEGILTGYVEFRIRDAWLRRLGVTAPKKGSHMPTVRRWVADVLDVELQRYTPHGNALERNRQARDVDRMRQDCARFLASDPELWIRDNDAGTMVYRPVIAASWGDDVLWRHGKKWLCMSGSIISTREQVASLGAGHLEVATVQVPMTFPAANRPVYVAPVANMSYKTKDDELPRMVDALTWILEQHPGDRVLVHCVSYKLAEQLHAAVAMSATGRPLFTYRNTAGRDHAFDAYAQTQGGVLFAASMDRGFDFADDLARVVVVAKVPFASLGDKQVAARLRTPGGNEWYAVQAARTVLQMTGRGVRNAEDRCATYILDSQFATNLYAKNRHLFPAWWRDAVQKSFNWMQMVKRDGARVGTRVGARD
jgi:Rad3-related DNA helicase